MLRYYVDLTERPDRRDDGISEGVVKSHSFRRALRVKLGARRDEPVERMAAGRVRIGGGAGADVAPDALTSIRTRWVRSPAPVLTVSLAAAAMRPWWSAVSRSRWDVARRWHPEPGGSSTAATAPSTVDTTRAVGRYRA